MHKPPLHPRPLAPASPHRPLLLQVLSSPQLLLLLFGLSLYLLTSGAYFDNPDGRSMYSVTRELVLHGSIAIPESERLDPLFEKVGREGAVYSKYGLVQPLVQIPLFLVGRWIAPGSERSATETAVSLLQAFATAATLPLLWSIARMIFESERVALALALIYGTATMAWLYATLTYSEPLLTLIVLAICWLLLRAEREHSASPVLKFSLAGMLAGLAILTKYPAVIYVPALLWYAWRISRRNHRRAWLAFAGPMLLGVLALAGYNLWRYGDVLNTGYHIKELTDFPRPPWYGLYMLFFSLGKSIFIYAPPLLLALYMLPRFARKAGTFGRFIVIVLCSSLLFYAIVSPWYGAWSPGPRYQLPVLPLALLPLGCLLARWKTVALWKRLVSGGIVLAGALVQLVAVFISYSDTLVLLQTITGGQYAWGFWFFDPDYMPLIWQGWLLASALARSVGGSTLFPEFGYLSSTGHPGMPIDQLNCWFAHLPADRLFGRLAAWGLLWILLLTLTALIYQAAKRYVRQRPSAGVRSYQHKEEEDHVRIQQS